MNSPVALTDAEVAQRVRSYASTCTGLEPQRILQLAADRLERNVPRSGQKQRERSVGLELKSCPFCDGDAELEFAAAAQPYAYVVCQTCEATGGGFGPEDDQDVSYTIKAITAWNTRASTPSTDLERLSGGERL